MSKFQREEETTGEEKQRENEKRALSVTSVRIHVEETGSASVCYCVVMASGLFPVLYLRKALIRRRFLCSRASEAELMCLFKQC